MRQTHPSLTRTIRSSVLSSNDTYNIGENRDDESSFARTDEDCNSSNNGNLNGKAPQSGTLPRPFLAGKFKYYDAIKTGFAHMD